MDMSQMYLKARQNDVSLDGSRPWSVMLEDAVQILFFDYIN
jgi:hypothetical protein